MNKQSEEWRDIQGYEGLYQVSDEGNVRRLVAMANGKYPAMGLIKSWPHKDGYLCVGLSKDKAYSAKTIHRLVAVAFLGNPPTAKHQVNHIDGNKANNCIGNLEWVTPSENMQHSRYVLGNNKDVYKLTPEEVLAIRRSDLPQGTIAKLYNVSQPLVSQIRLRKAWRYVD